MPLPFVGVDGEGGDVDDGTGFSTHTYTMLRAGDEYVTGDWLNFLATRPRRHIYVSYFFDYDVTMMLRDLPETSLRALVTGQEIRHDGFKLSYRPRKEFVVNRAGREVTINDVGTFFQCRFVTALERWNIGTVVERDQISEGKEDRSSFGALNAKTILYNEMECRALDQLMTKFRRTCEVIGYVPARWQGPGQLAKAMFKKHGIPQTKDLPEPPPGVWEMAQAAYYGGRFETSSVGPVRGPVEGWDINSAYPYAATLLPCLVHGKWIPSKTINVHGMYAVSFRHRKAGLWYGLPVRQTDGSIRYPREGSGWYWGVELESARLLGAEIKVHHGWELVPQCDCQWFEFMHRLYSVRKGMGKSEAGMNLKLGMNSAYGITAQAIGNPPYANPIWAGLFTAHTRATLNRAIAPDPAAVYMLATDGLFCRAGALPLVPSESLGGWERKLYPNGMWIVQPGVYFAGDAEPKTRGIPLSAVTAHEQELKDVWTGLPTNHLDIDLRQFIGLRLGLARNSPETMGQWRPVTKAISYDWSTKRIPRRISQGRTLPYDGSVDEWSVPYERFIGGNLIRNLDRLEFADTPDWAETLTEYL